jgi:hypothetical protein
MVYDKARSGDPDYDDKQPPEFHQGGQVVTAGDGVFITPQGGAVDANGAHVNLAGTTEDADNRPTPGNVAKVSSTVQDYRPEDTPTVPESVEDKDRTEAIRAGQASVIAAGEAMANGTVDEDKQADEQHSGPATSTPPRESVVKPTKSTK